MTTQPTTASQDPYDWSDPDRPSRARAAEDRDRVYDVTGRTAYEKQEKEAKAHAGRGGSGGGSGGAGGRSASSAAGDRHQGDRLIHAIERIEFTSDKDILALAKAINLLGRELHLILGMRAEELRGVLSQYQGRWFTFGTTSRVKARLVAAHLKVSAEAAKAIGVGALKMAYSFDRHFVKPEQEAKRKRQGKTARKSFTIGDQ